MKKLYLLLFLGLLFRLLLSVQAFSGDVHNHLAWAQDSVAHGFSGIYDRDFPKNYGRLSPNYPPIPLYAFTASYLAYQAAYSASWDLHFNHHLLPGRLIWFLQDEHTLPAFTKVWAIAADLVIAGVAFAFARHYWPSQRWWSYLSAAFILFNPAFFYNSATWGQIDALPMAFFLLALYFLLVKPKSYLSPVFVLLAVLSKQTVAIFLPVYLLLYFRQFNLKSALKSLMLTTVIFWLSFLPFYKSGSLLLFPFTTYLTKILFSFISNYTTDKAFNWWAIATRIQYVPDTIVWHGLAFGQWAYLVFLSLALLFLGVLCWRRFAPRSVFFGLALTQMAFFLFMTRIHERHFTFTLPFLVLALSPRRHFAWLVFIYLSFFNFLNLYFNMGDPPIILLKTFLSSQANIQALIAVTLCIFCAFVLRFLEL